VLGKADESGESSANELFGRIRAAVQKAYVLPMGEPNKGDTQQCAAT